MRIRGKDLCRIIKEEILREGYGGGRSMGDPADVRLSAAQKDEFEKTMNPFRSDSEKINENKRKDQPRFKSLPPLPPISTTPEYEKELSLIRTFSQYPEQTGEDIEQWLGSDIAGSSEYPGGITRKTLWKDPEDPYRKASARSIAMDLAASRDPDLRAIGQRLLKKSLASREIGSAPGEVESSLDIGDPDYKDDI